LAFAVSVNIDPDILILDEVLAVGDELFRRKSFAKMEEFFKAGKTILYVTHSINSINQLCSRAILLDKGEIILEGPPKLVTMHYQKYLFSKPNQKNQIRKELILLNQIVNKNSVHSENVKSSPSNIDSTKSQAKRISESANDYSAYLINDFKPKSTVIIKNYDVETFDFNILTLDGDNVNVLVMNEYYILEHKIKFNINVENVYVRIGFSSENGVPLSWKSSDYLDPLNKVKLSEDDLFLVQWKFKCLFLPGNYFVASVIGTDDKSKNELLWR
jgi:lipopolysaccharide transport system ATP-binding protein